MTLLPPMLRAEYDGAAVVLTGRVPDSGLRDAVVELARHLYGAGRVTDRMEVVPTTPAMWLDRRFPPDLRDTRRATALLQDGRLLVTGETATDVALARFNATLRATAAPSWRLDLRLNAGDVDNAVAGVAPGPLAPNTSGRVTAAKP